MNNTVFSINAVQDLVDYINGENSLFSNSGFVKFNSDYETGIDDRFPNGFYIGFSDQDENILFVEEGDKNPKLANYAVGFNLKLVAWFQCVDLDSAVKILLRQIKYAGRNVIQSVNLDAYSIYLEETGNELTSQMQIIRIVFQHQSATTLNDCEDLTICDEICCI